MIFGTEDILRTANESVKLLYLMYKREDGEEDPNYNLVKNGVTLKIPINLIEYETARGRFLYKPKEDVVYDYVTETEYKAEDIEEEKQERVDIMLRWLLRAEDPITKTYGDE